MSQKLPPLVDPIDYRRLTQPIAALASAYADGHVIPLHFHRRDQLLYAACGVVRVTTEAETWIVPPDRALYLPAGTEHSVRMYGDVGMRSLYIEPEAAPLQLRGIEVLAVSDLLRAAIQALTKEPKERVEPERSELLARLIESELCRAPRLPLYTPLPSDPRMQRLCAMLLADPADSRSLDALAAEAGASPRTLARLFEREFGMTFGQWRQRIRFHAALEALALGAPVACVAADAGYASASAFTAAFRKSMGFPPSRASRTPTPFEAG
jgi:AraC-like DNA-binding protein